MRSKREIEEIEEGIVVYEENILQHLIVELLLDIRELMMTPKGFKWNQVHQNKKE